MRHPQQVIDNDDTHDVPPAATRGMLHGDPMTHAAQARIEDVPRPQVTGGAPDYGPLVTETRRSDAWQPSARAFPVGYAVELIGRDDCRDRVDITNQSSAITGSTNPPVVFLFANEQQATNFADDLSAAQLDRLSHQLRMVVLPDGAGRTLKHTAPVWAVAYGGDGTQAVVDVSAERRTVRR